MKTWKDLKRHGYPGRIKLTTKTLRDYFATQVSAQVTDPNTVKELMRHTSLTTTSRYIRIVPDRLKEAVKKSGGNSWGNSGNNSQRKNTQNRMLIYRELTG